MKVLFVITQLDYADHMAVAFLSAVAKERGWQTSLCVLATDDFFAVLKRDNPDVVAYSANIMGFDTICSAHRAAQRRFRFISILGGPQATFSPETYALSEMDAYCVGEGELAFGEFLDNIQSGNSFDGVANLITRKSSNPVRPLLPNLDELPFPDRDLTLSHSYLKNTPKKTFYATRGCPFKCSYCCNNYYHQLYQGKGPFVRRFSVERVISEIEYVQSRYRTDFIKFGDDCFALKADSWLEEFAEKYARRVGIPFNCYLRLDTIDDDLLDLLKKANCYSVHLSVDSTSKHVRENVLHRNMRDINIEKYLRRFSDYGINTWVNYMLAVPGSTLEDDLSSIAISKKGKVTYSAYSTTVPMHGTELYDHCVTYGFIDETTHKSDLTGCSDKSSLSCFSRKEIDIRYNIFLLGAVIAKLPRPFFEMAIYAIKKIPPNPLFRKIRKIMYQYSIENKIFKLNT